jgi:hypothetical protein
MEYDDKLMEDAVLALLAALSSDDGNAWKGVRLRDHEPIA